MTTKSFLRRKWEIGDKVYFVNNSPAYNLITYPDQVEVLTVDKIEVLTTTINSRTIKKKRIECNKYVFSTDNYSCNNIFLTQRSAQTYLKKLVELHKDVYIDNKASILRTIDSLNKQIDILNKAISRVDKLINSK